MQIGFSIGLTRSMMRYGIIHIGNAKNIFHLAVQINMVFRISPNSISAKKEGRKHRRFILTNLRHEEYSQRCEHYYVDCYSNDR